MVLGHPNTLVAQDLRKLAAELASGSLASVIEAPAKQKKTGRFGLFAKS